MTDPLKYVCAKLYNSTRYNILVNTLKQDLRLSWCCCVRIVCAVVVLLHGRIGSLQRTLKVLTRS